MPLPPLNRQLLANHHPFPADLRVSRTPRLPERVIQFGEGNFLRGFVDWMIDRLNAAGVFNGSIVVLQPLPGGMAGVLNDQDGLYTLLLRGVQGGRVVEQKELLSAVSRGLDPYTQYADVLACAGNPDLRFVVSNTTEAGIATDPTDRPTDAPPKSFPGKLTAFLYERYKVFNGDGSKGLVVLACELIEKNGTHLRRCVLETASKWNLGADFTAWVEKSNVFCNTLVDRIVTGYPKDEAAAIGEQLGYADKLLDTGEIFHSWVIEGPKSLAAELPFDKVGLNVVWTDDYTPYRDRKVRILNGAHTMTVLAAYLAGKDTVQECMDDPAVATYLRRGLADEIIPTLDLPRADLESFAAAVLERFANPFVKHLLLSIALNSTSKWKARVLPSVKEFIKRTGTLPPRLTFSLAALIAFYRGTELNGGALTGHRPGGGGEYRIQDDQLALETMRAAWSAYQPGPAGAGTVVRAVLSHAGLWGEDLNLLTGFTAAVAAELDSILRIGAAPAMAALENRA